MPTNPISFARLILIAITFLAYPKARLDAETPTPTPTPAPVIQLVSPKVTYPEKNEKRYILTVVGSNLGTRDKNKNMFLYLDDNIVNLDWIKEATEAVDPDKSYGLVLHDETQLQFWLPWPRYSGELKLKVGVENRTSPAFSIIVSKIKSKWIAAASAAAVTLLLLVFPLWLVSRGGHAYEVGGKKYGVLAAFLLDKETDTYSLSKFQFYVWTSVAIFGYVYLAIVESMVQGKAVFPEIPDNLPGILLISAATGALATGITTARGPKGSGDIHPSMADFISAGGLVVSERFQFFVWTMLGAVTFLFFTLTSDPATLHDLPKIPDSFLQIMGISSLGYLGGKMARKPGPVIDNIVPKPVAGPPPTLTLAISGQKLSQRPTLRIDETDVPIVEAPDATKPSAVFDKDQSTKEDQGEFYKRLVFVISKPNPDWMVIGKAHKVTLTNDDGKAASWNYTP